MTNDLMDRTGAPGRAWVAEVIVVPKTGVNDPQGDAIRGGLRSLGYGSIANVRSGRFFRLRLLAHDQSSAEAEATSMCERLLANPVIETFTLSVHEDLGPSSLPVVDE